MQALSEDRMVLPYCGLLVKRYSHRKKIGTRVDVHGGIGFMSVVLPGQARHAYHPEDFLMLPEGKCLPHLIGNDSVAGSGRLSRL
ncbi:MAG TPA: hypothetical protein DEF45_18080 [Rhodopirellula sp.]|nr:hypothetical protein [Rhodopirellula sp.]